jgi:hypothetical protein
VPIPPSRKESKNEEEEVFWWSEGTPNWAFPSLWQERDPTRCLACDAAGPHDIEKGMCNKTVRSVLFCYSPPWEQPASAKPARDQDNRYLDQRGESHD